MLAYFDVYLTKYLDLSVNLPDELVERIKTGTMDSNDNETLIQMLTEEIALSYPEELDNLTMNNTVNFTGDEYGCSREINIL